MRGEGKMKMRVVLFGGSEAERGRRWRIVSELGFGMGWGGRCYDSGCWWWWR